MSLENMPAPADPLGPKPARKVHAPVETILWILGVFAVWLLLQLVVLPRLGVST
jgi:hypothetical protein